MEDPDYLKEVWDRGKGEGPYDDVKELAYEVDDNSLKSADIEEVDSPEVAEIKRRVWELRVELFAGHGKETVETDKLRVSGHDIAEEDIEEHGERASLLDIVKGKTGISFGDAGVTFTDFGAKKVEPRNVAYDNLSPEEISTIKSTLGDAAQELH